MATWLDLKTAVTGQLGGVDGGVYVAKREVAINRARRRYYSKRRWSFLKVDDATLTFTAQVAPLPSDYNRKFDPIDIYFYSGNIKYCFEKVEWGSIPSYQTDQYVFAINRKTNQIKINQTNVATATMEYTYLPADKTATDGSQDTDIEPAPDMSAIELLAIGYWWLAKERDEDNYKLFEGQYEQKMQEDIVADLASTSAHFFRPKAPYLIKGYRSQY